MTAGMARHCPRWLQLAATRLWVQTQKTQSVAAKSSCQLTHVHSFVNPFGLRSFSPPPLAALPLRRRLLAAAPLAARALLGAGFRCSSSSSSSPSSSSAPLSSLPPTTSGGRKQGSRQRGQQQRAHEEWGSAATSGAGPGQTSMPGRQQRSFIEPAWPHHLSCSAWRAASAA